MKIFLLILLINIFLFNCNNNSTNESLDDELIDEDNLVDMVENLETIFKMINEQIDNDNENIQIVQDLEEEANGFIKIFEDELNDIDLGFLEDLIENEREPDWPEKPAPRYKLIV